MEQGGVSLSYRKHNRCVPNRIILDEIEIF